jgi:hypothetical protein
VQLSLDGEVHVHPGCDTLQDIHRLHLHVRCIVFTRAPFVHRTGAVVLVTTVPTYSSVLMGAFASQVPAVVGTAVPCLCGRLSVRCLVQGWPWLWILHPFDAKVLWRFCWQARCCGQDTPPEGHIRAMLRTRRAVFLRASSWGRSSFALHRGVAAELSPRRLLASAIP